MNGPVLHVIPSVARRDGGPSAAVVGMCRALNALGCTAHIVTTDADGSARLPVPTGQMVNHAGVPTLFFPRTATVAFKWSPRLAHWLNAHVAAYRAVHVHAVFSHASIAAGRACRKAGVPYVVRPLGTLDPWSLERRAWRKRALLSLGARRLLTGANAMHYTTAEEGRLAEQALGTLPRAIVVPNGVDDEWFDVARGGRETLRILSLSRLDPKKGLDRLIAAFYAIADQPHARGWRLTVAGVGDPGYLAMLRARAAQGPGRDRIEFPGWVDGADKRRLLEEAALFVLPSSQENFGIAAAEALAAGVPVVLSSQVNLAGDVRNAGAGWIADEPNRLADVLTLAIQSAEERARRGACGRQLAESFRWQKVGGQLVAAYDQLTDAPRPVSVAQGVPPAPLGSASRH